MQMGRFSYVLIITVVAAVLPAIYPLVSGNWRFAHITIPLFSVAGFFIGWRVLRKHGLPFTATLDDMKKAVVSEQNRDTQDRDMQDRDT